MKLTINEATYRNVGIVPTDLASDTKFLKLDLLNQVMEDISDELYTILNKLEAVQRLAKAIGYKDIDTKITEISEVLSNTLDKDKNNTWKEILDNIEYYSQQI